MFRSFLALAVALIVSGFANAGEKFTLTGENTKVEFVGTKKDGKHTGGFKTLAGEVTHENDAWKIDVTIETDSLYSDDAKLTGHLKSGDFFAVKDHKTAKFVTSKITKGDKGYTVTGTVTLLGKSKEVTFPAEIAVGDTFTMKAEFTINRADFGMTYGEGKVDNDVALTVNVAAKK